MTSASDSPASPDQSAPDPAASGTRRPIWLAAIVLAALVAGVFFPVVGFEFVDFDTPGQVTENPYIRGLTWKNVKHILTSRCITSYYPVRTLSFAIDYELWGLNAGGFKLTNALVHYVNVLLVFWLIRRVLRGRAPPVPAPSGASQTVVATLAAGVFAVHPVVVEPVAWVPGREELLMTLGALLCIHCHIAARERAAAGESLRRLWAWHALAALCCAAACLSSANGAAIPLIVTAWDALLLARPRLWKIVWGTAALWAVAAGTIAIKIFSYTTEVVRGPPLLSAERLMLVAKVYAMNLKALVWPTDLAPSQSPYDPRSFSEAAVVAGLAAAVVTVLVLWGVRRRRLILFGLLWFVFALSPGSQIVISHVHRADRFLYLPLAGLLLATAVGLQPLALRARRPVVRFGLAAAGVWGLLLLVMLSAAQVQTWRNSLTMWENCVRVDPNNGLAQYALGANLAYRGQIDAAFQHRDRQLALDLADPEAMQFAATMAIRGTDSQPPNYALAVQLAERACQLSRWDRPKYRRTLAEAHSHLGRSLVDRGEVSRAVEHYRTALEADGDCEPALFQLAVILATTPDRKLRNPHEAVALAERAHSLKNKTASEMASLIVLATVYAEAWDFDKAIAATESAIQRAAASGDEHLAKELRGRLEVYRKRIPPESLR